ncbi:MAG: hypothetical protein J6V25_11090 [Oscillospiraceae bacterium]|nr:hypothetical protein [Oscillospiraceae bacterium]
MVFDEKATTAPISDEDLINIAGGSSIMDDQIPGNLVGQFITSTLTSYASGELPKYSVGDHVTIRWKIRSNMIIPCNAEVIGVSDSKGAGIIHRKYTYTVRICTCPNSDLIGSLVPNVHENCLFV